MRGAKLVWAIAAAWLAGAPAPRAETLTGAQIKALFTGNTVAGQYVGGAGFSEYHSPDGRAIGNNGFAINIDACWNTDGDRVCYHYGPYKDRRTYCFTVERVEEMFQLRVAESGKLNAIGKVEPGNSGGHGDGGRRWSCDDLLSRATPGGTGPSRDARKLARLRLSGMSASQ